MNDTLEKQKNYYLKNGAMIGASEYFRKLNEENKIASLLKSASSVSYYTDLEAMTGNIKKVIDEIYDDLDTYVSYIRFMPPADTAAIQTLVIRLDEVLELFENKYKNAALCLHILSLKDSRTAQKSRASRAEISEAVKKIKNGISGISVPPAERKTLVEKAAKSGTKSAAGSNAAKTSFLNTLVGKQAKNEKVFFADVMTEYHAHNTYRGIYRGKSTKDICSLDYISYCENKAFGSGLHASIKKNSQYKKNILSALNEISKTLSIDVKNAKILAEAENAKKIKEIEKQQTLVEKLSQIPKIPEGEVQEYTTTENQARVALAVEQLKKFKINTPLQTPKETFFPDEKDEPEMVVLGSYILSVEDTATLANHMKIVDHKGISEVIGVGSLLTNIFKAIPAIVSDCISMGSLAVLYSQDRFVDEEVIEAAKHGKRVKVTIIDFKNIHTSDSIRIKYEMID